MELLLILLAGIVIIALYFLAGVAIKFIWGWFPLLMGWIVAVVLGFLSESGTLGAIAAILLTVKSISWTNSWHDNSLYLKVERLIDAKFYFAD